MSRRAVNIATISEEDVLGEEIGEDGMVEMVSSQRPNGERTDGDGEVDGWSLRECNSNGTSSARESMERRDSMVEKDDDEEESAAEVSSSILSAISSLQGTLPRSSSTPSLCSSSSKSSPGSFRAPSPARSRSPAKTGSSPSSSLRRNMSWRGGRSPGSTLNLSGKFVTEFTLYDPYQGPVKTGCISLGLFIATDQTMGDHSVYKMSPVSPLAALKIQQQDRLMKVNDISVTNWPHNCLVEFIRNLPLSSTTNTEIPKGTAFEMPLCMEFRKTGKVIRSSDESPSSKRVAATLRIRNQRASILSVHDSVVRVRYSCHYQARIRLKGEQPLYLNSIIASNNTVYLDVGDETSSPDTVCFRLHQFDASPPRSEKGEVVLIETPDGEGFLHAISKSNVGLMHGLTAPPSTLLQTDVRFFQLIYVPGTSYVRIKNINTGQFISATAERIGLVGPGDATNLPSDTLFEVLRTDR